MSTPKVTISLPLFAIARDAIPNEKLGAIDHQGFHCRVDSSGSPCLVLFTSDDCARQYIAGRPTLAKAHMVTLSDSLGLEIVIADVRQLGCVHAVLDPDSPATRIRLDELAQALLPAE
jgi:hypothetical protein